MSVVLTAKELKQGKKGSVRTSPAFVQPLQMIPRAEKTEEWAWDNADFLELHGLRQIWRKAPGFAKNFNLAAGIIDKNDYVGGNNPDTKQLLDNLMSHEEETYLDLRFYPIIPNFINVMCAEFAKRNTKITFTASDEYSYNEMLAMKEDQVTSSILREATEELFQKLIDSGLDPKDPANKDQFAQQLDPENVKSLPEIQQYFNKNYRSMVEEWAVHQHKEDVLRFRMDELEERNFRNSLITDSAYFHYKMLENDYDVEVWNPMFTAVFKSPELRYTSQAHAAINVTMMSIPEVLEKFGQIMNEEQALQLQTIYPHTNVGYDITGYPNQSNYDNTKSHEWNVEGPSVAMRQLSSTLQGVDLDMVSRLMNPENFRDRAVSYFLRVTTGYWKSQRKVGFLTKIDGGGAQSVAIVDEDYVVTDIPVYNNQLIQNRNADTLIFGEHIEWIYINQVWGFTKIGPNIPSYWGMPVIAGTSGMQPIYLGVNQNKIGPLKYQFKGDNTVWGCKLPVEGCTFSDYNTKSTSPVDLLKPFQIGYNVVNNQIQDILMDELGTIIALDPNTLPQKSLGEDWGKANYAKAYVAMKNFSILPTDRSLANVEGGALQANAPLQQLDLSQTQRLFSRIQLATYFKNEGLSLFGVTPQRLGQPLGRQTATAVEENINASYAQTERYFINFSDYLMPRVYQMLTDLAQYYQSQKPSVRLQYMTSKDERVNFQINGIGLLLRDLNIHHTSTTNNRNVMEELRKLLITNNTAKGTIYELGNLLTADSLGEMNNILKDIEKKAEDQQRQANNEAQMLQKQKDDAAIEELRIQQDFVAREAEKNRRRDILVAEIRGAGYSGAVDLNQNAQNDYLDNLDRIQSQDEFQQTMDFKRQSEGTKTDLNKQKIDLEREKIAAQRDVARTNLDIARANTTASEIEAKRKAAKKDAEQKNKKK